MIYQIIKYLIQSERFTIKRISEDIKNEALEIPGTNISFSNLTNKSAYFSETI